MEPKQLSFIETDYISDAVISDCGKYRYSLSRIWEKEKGIITFICLNPSTADAKKDDPTIRRCIGYSKDWGYGGFYMANLFAFRATDPKIMKQSDSPIGPLNNNHLLNLKNKSSIIIAAWGTNGNYRGRDKEVLELMGNDLYCLEKSQKGHPKHPLYLKKDLKPIPYF